MLSADIRSRLVTTIRCTFTGPTQLRRAPAAQLRRLGLNGRWGGIDRRTHKRASTQKLTRCYAVYKRPSDRRSSRTQDSDEHFRGRAATKERYETWCRDNRRR